MRARWVLCAVALTACGEDADPCVDAEPGTVCTWLGLPGEAGFNGDGLPRWETQVNEVQDLVFLADGTALYSDLNNHLVRRVTTDGRVETVVGWTDPVFPGDGPLGGIPAGGAAGTDWQLTHPTALLLRDDGTVLLAAWHNYKVLRIDPTGRVEVVAGGDVGFEGDGGPATDARFARPNDLAYDAEGRLFVVDQQNERLRRIDPDGTITTVAGDGTFGSTGDGGPAADATLSWADSSSPNPSGNVEIVDGSLYVADTEAHRIRRIDLATGIIEAFAGTGEGGFAGDGGPAIDSKLRGPRDMELGPDGDLYFADTDNGAVRAIDLSSGTIRTVVGTGELGRDEDGRDATASRLGRAFGIAFDAAGALYVMDSVGQRIVKVTR
ncbi:MAG: hypothetical protein RMA76_00300 [Deltaproteobacteria bacterium]|jgi:sugar lactone lactonase YvrE